MIAEEIRDAIQAEKDRIKAVPSQVRKRWLDRNINRQHYNLEQGAVNKALSELEKNDIGRDSPNPAHAVAEVRRVALRYYDNCSHDVNYAGRLGDLADAVRRELARTAE